VIETIFTWATLIGNLIFAAVMLFTLVGLAFARVMTIFRR
jgi:hypothetical protein